MFLYPFWDAGRPVAGISRFRQPASRLARPTDGRLFPGFHQTATADTVTLFAGNGQHKRKKDSAKPQNPFARRSGERETPEADALNEQPFEALRHRPDRSGRIEKQTGTKSRVRRPDRNTGAVNRFDRPSRHQRAISPRWRQRALEAMLLSEEKGAGDEVSAVRDKPGSSLLAADNTDLQGLSPMERFLNSADVPFVNAPSPPQDEDAMSLNGDDDELVVSNPARENTMRRVTEDFVLYSAPHSFEHSQEMQNVKAPLPPLLFDEADYSSFHRMQKDLLPALEEYEQEEDEQSVDAGRFVRSAALTPDSNAFTKG